MQNLFFERHCGRLRENLCIRSALGQMNSDNPPQWPHLYVFLDVPVEVHAKFLLTQKDILELLRMGIHVLVVVLEVIIVG